MEYIAVAKLNKTFGIKGEFRAYCLTDYPKQRFQKGKVFSIGDEKGSIVMEVTLSSYRMDTPFVILKFNEISSINEAEKYLGKSLYILKEEASLPEDTYHIHDLIDCDILLENGERIGVCIDVLSYSPTKTLIIAREGKENAQIPFAKQFIKLVDIDKKQIVITPIEGLL